MSESEIPIDGLEEAGEKLYGDDIFLHGMAFAIIRSVVAIVSVISSSLLVWMLLRSKARLSTTNNRILFGMAVSDILFSLSLALFNVLAPRDIDYIVWNARGGEATCSAQGFLWSIGAGISLLYHCSLNFYFLAVVKYNKTDEYIRNRIEPFLHGVPTVFTLSVGITLLVKKNFNAVDGGTCNIPVYSPLHCNGYGNGEIREGFGIPCGRGADGVPLLSYAFFFIIMVIVPLVVGISLGMIYRSVSQQENRMGMYGANSIIASQPSYADESTHCQPCNVDERASTACQPCNGDERVNGSSWWNRLRNSMISVFPCLQNRRFGGASSSTPNQGQSNSNSSAVLQKAFAYSVACFLTWSFVVLGVCLTAAGMPWPLSIWYLSVILNPLQGLFNVLIYLHPKVKREKSRGENATWFQAFYRVICLQGN